MSAPDELLTPAEVAHMLRVKVKTLEHWRWRRVGPPVVRIGRCVRYRRADVADWVASGGDTSGR